MDRLDERMDIVIEETGKLKLYKVYIRITQCVNKKIRRLDALKTLVAQLVEGEFIDLRSML
jgi:geranylgeranyl pyrophosphate synthase